MPLQLLALPNGLKEQRRSGRRDVERVDLAPLRKGDQTVAGGGDARAQALALTAQNEHRRADEVDVPGRLPCLRVGPPDPEAGLLCLRQPVSEVAHMGDRQMLD